MGYVKGQTKGIVIPISSITTNKEMVEKSSTEFLQNLKSLIDQELEIRLVSILSKCRMEVLKDGSFRIFPMHYFFSDISSEELIFISQSQCQFSKLAQEELMERDKDFIRNKKEG